MDDIFSVTKSQLVNEIQNLGLSEGQTVMLHASVKRIGHITWGPQAILDALFEILTPRGTLMMLVGWADNPYNIFGVSFQDDIDEWPENGGWILFHNVACPIGLFYDLAGSRFCIDPKNGLQIRL